MDLRYPIGKYETKTALTSAERVEAITRIAETPKHMRDAVGGLSGGQFDTPYRPGGWTVRQVVHHVPDSHMNAYVRMKLALTEDEPTIKPYEEGLWANLPDSRETPVEVSLSLLEFLHLRWSMLLRAGVVVVAGVLCGGLGGCASGDNQICERTLQDRVSPLPCQFYAVGTSRS